MGVNYMITYMTGGWKLFDFDMGVCHVDDVFVMFKPHVLPYGGLLTKEDEIANRRLLDYWVNFVRFAFFNYFFLHKL